MTDQPKCPWCGSPECGRSPFDSAVKVDFDCGTAQVINGTVLVDQAQTVACRNFQLEAENADSQRKLSAAREPLLAYRRDLQDELGIAVAFGSEVPPMKRIYRLAQVEAALADTPAPVLSEADKAAIERVRGCLPGNRTRHGIWPSPEDVAVCIAIIDRLTGITAPAPSENKP